MKKTELKQVIENFWDEKESINSGNKNLTNGGRYDKRQV